MKLQYILAISAALAVEGCLLSPSTPLKQVASPAIEITKEIEAREATPTEVVCTTSLNDVALTVSPVTHTSARVELRGLIPGEKLTILFIAQSDEQHTREITVYPSEGADESGVFITQEDSLSPLPDVTTNLWTVKVVHSRGVACAEVMLP
jgi:hypothetical protein